MAYANGLSLLLALFVLWVSEQKNVHYLTALNQTQTVITFMLPSLMMIGVRVVVKTLDDVTVSNKRVLWTLVYRYS